MRSLEWLYGECMRARDSLLIVARRAYRLFSLVLQPPRLPGFSVASVVQGSDDASRRVARSQQQQQEQEQTGRHKKSTAWP